MWLCLKSKISNYQSKMPRKGLEFFVTDEIDTVGALHIFGPRPLGFSRDVC